jgi:hypothetical protein
MPKDFYIGTFVRDERHTGTDLNKKKESKASGFVLIASVQRHISLTFQLLQQIFFLFVQYKMPYRYRPVTVIIFKTEAPLAIKLKLRYVTTE